MAKQKRTVFEVVWRKKRDNWGVNYRTTLSKLSAPDGGSGLFIGSNFAQKIFAVKYAVAWARANQPSQLFIKGKNSKILDERTYGSDPRRTKG